jgi:hypothetical protein
MLGCLLKDEDFGWIDTRRLCLSPERDAARPCANDDQVMHI